MKTDENGDVTKVATQTKDNKAPPTQATKNRTRANFTLRMSIASSGQRLHVRLAAKEGEWPTTYSCLSAISKPDRRRRVSNRLGRNNVMKL
jgi:hypothetical protein